ncbi:DEDD exonuclease domain-containing protein [Gordonia polyisoprenivorans]|uniref:DEDD exonuclease domain-containing protein n=1 Tax=Gordonia TaxID=2053 RepID=UPI001B8BFA21|nr:MULTISPECIES: DEDD exonuclease domain-containing protein [Gordonia]MDF3280260.1 DEDD exonuclease domain-containing protein [Gordonia sp. N1V]QUD84644.1 DEDD exonuclease domain-containing protein [Gordonia polyisoprenivorans]
MLSVGRTSVRGVVVDTAQLSFADLGAGADTDDAGFGEQSLFDTTIVVVDLETTGGDPARDAITEIGAVKVRGGEVLGEFATLVDPQRSIPPQIVALTGITSAMVYDAPQIGEVLSSFVEFARGCLLVAHNARFDMGFLRHNAARLDLAWPFHTSLCTVRLARRVLTRDEAPTVRLGALADLFDVSVRPTHRALDDARATVEVLHRLLERIGNQGVRTYADLTAYLPRGNPRLRAKRHLAEGLPARPGVYLFRGPSAEVLYVGTATDLRRRVMSYFNGSDPRPRIAEMVNLAVRVDHVECAHALEAGVRELRLIVAHTPAYNRRSTRPHRGWWITLTGERFPRLQITRTPGTDSVGPVANRNRAAEIAELISRAAGLRTCRARMPGAATHHWCRTPADGGDVLGGCAAATDRPLTVTDYVGRVQAAHDLLSGRDSALLSRLIDELDRLTDAQMFETAARHRDRVAATIDTLARCQRLSALCRIAEIVVARTDGAGGWELAVIRHGRLASAGHARRGVAPMPVVDALVTSAETVLPGEGPLLGASPEESALLYRWLGEPGVRIVAGSEGFASPVGSAACRGEWAAAARSAAETAVPRRRTPAPHPKAVAQRAKAVRAGGIHALS